MKATKPRSFAVVSKTKPNGGWKNTPDDGDHMLFARAEAIASLCCLNAKGVYDMAVREGTDLKTPLDQLGKAKKPLGFGNPWFCAVFDSVVSGSPLTTPTP